MTHRRMTAASRVAFVVIALASAGALAQEASMITPHDIKWMDAPPVLPKGAKMAVLMGDPSKPGPYVIRLKAPPGYKIAPHWHSLPEELTVISGTFYLGVGDDAKTKGAHALGAGSFHYLPAQQHHYAFTRGNAVLQINATGPFDINYLNAADDPQKKM